MITEVVPNIFRFEILMPGPLKSVNCYLMRGSDGWSLIDSGPKMPGMKQRWEAAFAECGAAFSDLASIVITHAHVDHLGMAGWLQQQSGARVYMSAPEYNSLQEHYNKDFDTSRLTTALTELGLEKSESDRISTIFGSAEPMIAPRPEVTVLNDPTISLSGIEWEILLTTGHTDGHICLYSREQHLLLSGDQVLPSITSVIKFPNSADDNPLGDYLDSLRQLSKLDSGMVLPAHGGVIQNLSVRIRELFAHHDERLGFILDRLRQNGEQTVKQLVDALWGKTLNTVDLFLATGEITSHLIYLRNQNRICTRQSGAEKDLIFFSIPLSSTERPSPAHGQPR
ncbi:MAG: MBL fold metallo-hydrolase [Solirubrobacterales bacterium]